MVEAVRELWILSNYTFHKSSYPSGSQNHLHFLKNSLYVGTTSIKIQYNDSSLIRSQGTWELYLNCLV